MGQELQRRSPGTVARQSDPPWSAVASTTMRLWLDRHYRRRAGRRRLVLLVSALLAMALGAGVTLAFTQPGPGTARQVKATSSADAPQLAAAARQQAAAWITHEVASDITVGCDPVMCQELQRSGLPGDRQLPLQPSAADPLGAAGGRQLRLRREPGGSALYRAGRQQGVRSPAPGRSPGPHRRGPAAARQQSHPGLRGCPPGTYRRAGRSASSCNAFDTCGPNAAAADSVR
jgi:hypothetical protein